MVGETYSFTCSLKSYFIKNSLHAFQYRVRAGYGESIQSVRKINWLLQREMEVREEETKKGIPAEEKALKTRKGR